MPSHRPRSTRRRNAARPGFELLEARSLLAAGSIAFNSATYTVADTAGSIVITLERTGGTIGAVGATLSTSDGTAKAPLDYTAVSKSVSFPSGTTSENVSIPVRAEPVGLVAARTFTITLSNPTGGA
jgi:hypothetical protein